MEKPKSSYTDKDLKDIEAYIFKHPRCHTWTTQEGLTIPIVMLKDDHLRKVIGYIKKRLKDLPKSLESQITFRLYNILELCELELKNRLIKKSTAGRVLFGD